MRLWAGDFYRAIVDKGAARVNYHPKKTRANKLFLYKSTSRSKLYLNPLHRHFENAKKRPSFCKQAHTARPLTIYNRIDSE